jgi:hypothetical protein
MNPPAFHPGRHAGAASAIACLAILCCAPAQASRTAPRHAKHRPAAVSPTKSAAAPVVTAAASPLPAAGMVVAIDPETGALVPPTAAQVQRLTAAERTGLMRTSEGLTQVHLPGGAVMVDLQGRFMEYTLVRLDRQGNLHFTGVNEAPALLRLLDPGTPAPTPAREER